MSLQPLVKWAGGKRQIMDKLLMFKPKKFKRYFEPFVGGGALMLELSPKKVTINDFNKELVNIYKCLRSKTLFKKFYDLCKKHEQNHSEEYYYQIRDLDRKKTTYSKMTIPEKAARCLYLNKTCFNGLYRVNTKGYFNVPSAKRETVRCFDEENIKALHKYFSKVKPIILNKDFTVALKTAKAGDFVYLDPPYDVINDQSFTSYTTNGFDKNEQIRLRDTVKELTNNGVLVMISNANTEFIREIYKDFNLHVINAKRMINSKGDKRGAVEELIITNY